MSLGFSASDFVVAIKLSKAVFDAVRNGPKEYKELQGELKSMQYVLQSLSEDSKDASSLLCRKGCPRKAELMSVVHNSEDAVGELQILVDKHSELRKDDGGRLKRVWHSYRVGRADLDSLRGRLTFYTSTIDLFLTSLQGSAISRIEQKLDQLYSRLVDQDSMSVRQSCVSSASTTSVLSLIETDEDLAWEGLKGELLLSGVSMAHVMTYREDIIDHIKSLLKRNSTSALSIARASGNEIISLSRDEVPRGQRMEKPELEDHEPAGPSRTVARWDPNHFNEKIPVEHMAERAARFISFPSNHDDSAQNGEISSPLRLIIPKQSTVLPHPQAWSSVGPTHRMSLEMNKAGIFQGKQAALIVLDISYNSYAWIHSAQHQSLSVNVKRPGETRAFTSDSPLLPSLAKLDVAPSDKPSGSDVAQASVEYGLFNDTYECKRESLYLRDVKTLLGSEWIAKLRVAFIVYHQLSPVSIVVSFCNDSPYAEQVILLGPYAAQVITLGRIEMQPVESHERIFLCDFDRLKESLSGGVYLD